MSDGNFLATMFFGGVPLAVARSLREEPHRWQTDQATNRFMHKAYELEHDSGGTLWVSNGTYGMEVKAPGVERWGGVTMLSSVYLSPGHHLLRAAANRWLRAHGYSARGVPKPVPDLAAVFQAAAQ